MSALGRLAITLPSPFHDARACVELAKKAEQEWGYRRSGWPRPSGPDSFALAGAMAWATSSIEIGTAIVPVYNRTPAVLAMGAGTLAQLSGDRFVLGLGSSSHTIIGDWNGIDFEAPLGHVKESVAILRQALAGEKTDFAGRHFRSKGLQARQPAEEADAHLPGGAARADAAARGRHRRGADHQLPAGERDAADPRGLPRGRRRGRARRDADEVVCRFQVCLTNDRAKARGLVRLGFGAYLATPVYNAYLDWCGFPDEARAIREAFARRDRQAVAAAIPDELVDRIAILGTRGRVPRAARGLREGRRDDAGARAARDEPRRGRAHLRDVRARREAHERRASSLVTGGSGLDRAARSSRSSSEVRPGAPAARLAGAERARAPARASSRSAGTGSPIRRVRSTGAAAVVHLAGEPIFGGLPTRARRERIWTQPHRLDEADRRSGSRSCRRNDRPGALVCASAVGFYGDRGEEELRENAPPGEGFLADLCVAWEAEAQRAAELGVRVAQSALRRRAVAARAARCRRWCARSALGLGGRIGSGRQWFSWIHRDDVAALARRAVDDVDFSGAFNAVAPEPVRNADFTRAARERATPARAAARAGLRGAPRARRSRGRAARQPPRPPRPRAGPRPPLRPPRPRLRPRRVQ